MVICKVLAGFIRVGVGAVVILLITDWLLTYWRFDFGGVFGFGRGLTQLLRLCRGCRGDVLGPRFDWNTLNVRLACCGRS